MHPDRIIANIGARPRDWLYLTKPLGIGIITTAIKREMASEGTIKAATELIATLNAGAGAAMAEIGVSAGTDITGFGLVGHLHEMTRGSGVRARVHLSSVPVLDQAWDLVRQGVVPGGSHNNRAYFGQAVEWADDIDEAEQLVLCDAQTSGVRLISVSAEKASQLEEALHRHGVPYDPIPLPPLRNA